jgi:mono/diheme cytochrome c family protein
VYSLFVPIEARIIDLGTRRRIIRSSKKSHWRNKMMKFLSILIAIPLLVSVPRAHAADAMTPTVPGIGDGKAFPQTQGADLYEAVCQACHMPEGVGATAASSYPALAKNPRLLPKAYPITRVLNGSRGMPAFKSALSDEQIVAVVGYVRTHFGNHYADKISPEDVKALRP